MPDQAELVAAVLGPATEEFLARYGEQLGDEDSATLRKTAAAIGRWTVQGREPFAVVHGDYRLDNLMFGPSGEDVSALDWQNVSVGPPGRDLAYFVGTTFEAPERRRHEDALVAAYHESLLARDVVGYGLIDATTTTAVASSRARSSPCSAPSTPPRSGARAPTGCSWPWPGDRARPSATSGRWS